MSFANGSNALPQRKSEQASRRKPAAPEAPPIVNEVLRSPGQSLDPAVRAFIEPRFSFDFNRVPVQPGSPMVKIPCAPANSGRLAISAPGDRYEKEAEQMAEQVMQMPVPAAGVQPGAWQTAPSQIGAYGGVQAQAQPGQTPQLTRKFENQIGALQGGGQPLAEPVRTSMESRFGHDFSRVHIHTDQTAATLAASINARAFTLRRDVVFGAGQYAPGSETGRRLLAHELTHVVQQRAGAPYVARACDQATTHVADAPTIIEQARAEAIQYVNAAIPIVRHGLHERPDSWFGTVARELLDRHFHCPTREHMEYILMTLQEIGARLPTVSLDCLGSDHGTHGEHFTRSVDLTAGLLYSGFFHDPQSARAGTLVTLVAQLLSRSQSYNRHDSHYNDFTRVGPGLMMSNSYSYGYFSTAAGGHEVVPEPPGGVTCRPPEPDRPPPPLSPPLSGVCSSEGTITSRQIVIPTPPKRAHVLTTGSDVDGEIYEERVDRDGRRFVCARGRRIEQRW